MDLWLALEPVVAVDLEIQRAESWLALGVEPQVSIALETAMPELRLAMTIEVVETVS